ncbi:arsenate reductase ArsC [Candidatus Omnitrophota bacterium]
MKKKKVLFICIYNSARSQMAEGLLRALCGDRYEVYSAGIFSSGVNPDCFKTMKEIQIDISGQRSKSITELQCHEFDYVVTLCSEAEDSCPVFPTRHKKIHWNLEDPVKAQGSEEERLAVFRKVRGQIQQNIETIFK